MLLACLACFIAAGYRRRKKKEEEETTGACAVSDSLPPTPVQEVGSLPPLEAAASPTGQATSWPTLSASPSAPSAAAAAPRSSWADTTGVELRDASASGGMAVGASDGSVLETVLNRKSTLGVDDTFASMTHLPMPPNQMRAAGPQASADTSVAATVAAAAGAARPKWMGLGGGSDDVEELGNKGSGSSPSATSRPKWASLITEDEAPVGASASGGGTAAAGESRAWARAESKGQVW